MVLKQALWATARGIPFFVDLHGGANTNYLLQVWHQGRKIMQERLNQEVKQWAVCFDYFIYKTVDPDEQSRYFQMYDLKKPECLTLIEDFLRDESYGHFVFNNNKFYAANSTCIKIAFVKPSNQEYTKVTQNLCVRLRLCAAAY